jgi:hypothetical protein
MIQTIVESIEQVNEFPAVKKVYNSRFVKSNVNQFEGFIGKIVRKNVEKAVEPSRKKTNNTQLDFNKSSCISLFFRISRN